jgi:hypothetical protein
VSAAPPSRKLGTTLLVATGFAALGAAAVVSHRYFNVRPLRPTAAAPAPPSAAALAPAPSDEALFQVTAASGTVEAQRGGLWLPIKKGDTLSRTDLVRTAAGGRAVLSLSTGTEIELRERVEIELDRLAKGTTVDLRRGKVVARVSGSDGLAITSRDTRTANEGPAHFVVLSDERGRVSVAALSGKATFTAGGKSLTLPEGTQSSSEGGAPPSDPERIPEEVLLEVVWPAAEQRHGVEKTEVQGKAAPSSTVTVNGARATVGPDGRFTATVPLKSGKNSVDVAAEDLAGRTRQTSATLVRRGAPPALTPESTDLWKK